MTIETVKKLTKAKIDGNGRLDFRRKYRERFFYPVPTREDDRARFRSGFFGVVGVYVRLVCGMSPKLNENLDSVVSAIVNDISINDNVISNKDLESIIRKIVFINPNSSNRINISTIPMFKFCRLTPMRDGNDEAKAEELLGEFLFQALGFPESMTDVFNDTQLMNFLEELIYNKMQASGNIEETNHSDSLRGAPFIPDIKSYYIQDVKNLLQDREAFIKDFPLLLQYYAFYYLTRLSFMVNDTNIIKNTESSQSDERTPPYKFNLYYLFEDEVLQEGRWAGISQMGDKVGYNYIVRMVMPYLVNKVMALAQLNAIVDTQHLLLPEILEVYNNAEDKQKIDADLREWLNMLKRYEGLSIEAKESGDWLQNVSTLYDLNMDIGKSKKLNAVNSRFPKQYDELAKVFVRNHKRNGLCLHISQDFLLLMLKLCKYTDGRSERIKLNEFFKRLEARGIYFDNKSASVIESRLNELNLLDKKSDSGDAAYV